MTVVSEGAAGQVAEVVAQLDRAVARLVVAGSGSAKGDVELERLERALEELGRSSPAMASAARAAGELRAARGRAASEALLSMSAQASRLRGALSRAALASGEMASLPSAEPVDTPLEHHELEAVVRAIAADSAAGAKVLRDAIDRDRVRDLRLLDPFIDGLSTSGETSDRVARALSAFGEAAAPRLRALLARSADEQVARLRRSDRTKAVAEALVERRRAGAIQALAAVDPGGTRPIALSMARDRSEGAWVRRGAMLALCSCPDDEGLDLLLTRLEGQALPDRSAACAALARFPHPRAGERLAARYRAAVSRRNKLPKNDGRRSVELVIEHLTLDALGRRRDPSSIEQVLSIWRGPLEVGQRWQLGQALLEALEGEPLRSLAAEIDHKDAQVRGVALRAVFKLGPADAFEALSERLSGKRLSSKAGVGDALVVVGALADQPKGWLDDRWAALLTKVAEQGDGAPERERLSMECLALLASAGRAPKRAISAALGRASGWPWRPRGDNSRSEWLWHSLCELIEEAGDRSLLAEVVAVRDGLSPKGTAWVRSRLDEVVEALSKPSPAGGAKPSAR